MYICKICNKEFNNPRSLGGHISSHYRTCYKIHNHNKTKCINCNKDITYYKRKPKFCSQDCRWKYHRKIKDESFAIVNGDIINITNKELNKIKQNITKCQICGKSVDDIKNENNHFKQLFIDHDHNTMKFRGLLCLTCNSNLSWFEKNRDNILNYLDNQ